MYHYNRVLLTAKIAATLIVNIYPIHITYILRAKRFGNSQFIVS